MTGDGRVLIIAVLDPEVVKLMYVLASCAAISTGLAFAALLLYWKREPR